MAVLFIVRNRSARTLVLSPSGLEDGIHTAAYAQIKIARAKGGKHFAFDDSLGDNIWQSALKPVADLDAGLSIIRKNKKDNTIVVLALTDAPSLGSALRKILQGVSVRDLGKCCDDHLARCVPLEGFETRIQRRDGLW